MKKKKRLVLKTDEEIRVCFDPFRHRIINVYMKNSETSLTLKQVADIMNEKPSKVHYHAMKLVRLGVLGLDKTEVINSIVAKYYTPLYEEVVIDSDNSMKTPQISDKTQVVDSDFDDSHSKWYSQKLEEHKKFLERSDDKDKLDFLEGHFDLYMTPEERTKVVRQIFGILKEYTKEDSKKEVFASLIALVRTK